MPSLKSINNNSSDQEKATVQVGRRQYSQEHFARIRSISHGRATFDPEPAAAEPQQNATRPENEGADKRSDAAPNAHQPAAVSNDPKPITAGIVSKKYNASAGETVIELILPQGKLGIDIQSVIRNGSKVCKVVKKNNPSTLLEVGDVIVSLNGINLSNIKTSLNLGVWTTLFKTESNKGPMRVIVRRPDSTGPSIQESNKSATTAEQQVFTTDSKNVIPSQITVPTVAAPQKTEKTSGYKRKCRTSSFAGIAEIKTLEDRLKSAKKFEKLAREEVKAAEKCLRDAKKKWEAAGTGGGGKKRAVSPTDEMEVLV